MISETSRATGAITVVASGKLPDDLTLEEFSDLVGAVTTTVSASQHLLRTNQPAARNVDSLLHRVQYGSDFLVVVSLATVAGTVLTIAKGIDTLAAAGLKNEERLGKKAERLNRRAERQRKTLENLTVENIGTRGEANDVATLASIGIHLESRRDARKLRQALELLAEYGVKLKVEQD